MQSIVSQPADADLIESNVKNWIDIFWVTWTLAEWQSQYQPWEDRWSYLLRFNAADVWYQKNKSIKFSYNWIDYVMSAYLCRAERDNVLAARFLCYVVKDNNWIPLVVDAKDSWQTWDSSSYNNDIISAYIDWTNVYINGYINISNNPNYYKYTFDLTTETLTFSWWNTTTWTQITLNNSENLLWQNFNSRVWSPANQDPREDSLYFVNVT